MSSHELPPSRGPVRVVLGPTNTGKTHLAVERMLGHATGIIGLPLRLLAREIYDRISAAKGPRRVALVTGEEKIVPPHPQWFVCTVEAMPLDRSFEFLAIDEIQLMADAERGHVFTERLLHARGTAETMFMGADTVRHLIKRLVPGAEFETRERLSHLSYAGPKKLSRLPRRSAIVAFSSADVYGIAELVRHQRGGAAVVMGALSPRTRNAQVAMYQSGEVDFLVATDAIGMGLNMDVDHVAFAATRKFDGVTARSLTPSELGQIAGRAGRNMNNGTFGTTAEIGPLEPDMVEKIENHRFDPVVQARWRNRALEFRDVGALLRSLDAPPPMEGLVKAREAEDYMTLRALAPDREVIERVRHPGHVRLLWQVCQIPDFRKTLRDQHVRLAREIFLHLAEREGVLPTDWVARQVARLERTDGEIDTLAGRLAHIRTWTYIAHRGDWLADSAHWQERARAIEDKLSDALHERLTQRFVDRRAAALARGLRSDPDMGAQVGDDGAVMVADQFIGTLNGLVFLPDGDARGPEGRTLRNAANRTLGQAIAARAGEIANGGELVLGGDGAIRWRGAEIARLRGGDHVLRPRLVMIGGEELDGALRDRLVKRLETFVAGEISRRLAPLHKLETADLAGMTRGLAYQLGEGLGVLLRDEVVEQVRALDQPERHKLRRLGVTFGETSLFMPALLKPDAAALKGLLWSIRYNAPVAAPPLPGLTSLVVPPDRPRDPRWWLAAGFVRTGERAIRIDMLERVALLARKAAEGGPFTPTVDMLSLLGCGTADLPPVLRLLGYVPDEADKFRRKPHGKGRRPRKVEVPVDEHSPFARLKELKAG